MLSSKIVETEEGTQEVRQYARGTPTDLDFGALNARNRLILEIFNPLLDEIMKEIRLEHVIDSETRFGISVLIQSHRDIEPPINGAEVH